MKTYANESVYPVEVRTSPHAEVPPTMLEGGLTKREHFASLALKGLSNGVVFSDIESFAKKQAKIMAADAVLLADTLIEELNLEKTKNSETPASSAV